jgi:hypothetical protein
VLVGAIAAVDHRHAGVARRDARGAVLGMPHDEDVGVAAADDADGIGERLALAAARVLLVGGGDDAPAEAQHRRLEAEPRARARLEEQRRHDRAAAQLGPRAQVGAELVRVMEQFEDLGGAQVLDGNQVALLVVGHRSADHARARAAEQLAPDQRPAASAASASCCAAVRAAMPPTRPAGGRLRAERSSSPTRCRTSAALVVAHETAR